MKYYSNWSELRRAIIVWCAVILLSWWGAGIDKYWLIGVGAAVAYICFVIWERYHRYIEITDNRYLRNAGTTDFWQKDPVVDIFSIKYIGRTYNPISPYWSRKIIIFAIMPEGRIMHTNIGETQYDEEILRDLINKLKSLNPNIQLDPAYQQLLEGLPEGKRLKDFSEIKTHSQLTKEVEEKFGVKL